MTWGEHLFAVLEDLEGEAEALHAREREDELADRSRAEYAAVTLPSRLAASEQLVLDVRGVGRLPGELTRLGDGWALMSSGAAEWLVNLAAVMVVHGASPRAVPEVAWSPVSRLGLGAALRRVEESGDRCLLHLVDGQVLEGTLGRVGADFTECRLPNGDVVLVSFPSLAAVQRWTA